MKNRMETLITLLLFVVMLIAGCSGCAQKTIKDTPVVVQPTKEVVVEKKAQQTLRPLTSKDFEKIISHRDHPHSHTSITIPEAPEGDDFFPTIQFPKEPPKRPDGHYVPEKYPFAVPEFVTENPDRFFVNEKGEWYIQYPPDFEEKELELMSKGLSGDAFSKKYAELVAEGLDTLPAAVTVLRAHVSPDKSEAKALFEQALEENPNDFYALIFYGGLIKSDNYAEAEAVFRKAAALRPESVLALNSLSKHLSNNFIEDGGKVRKDKSKLGEAIFYAEKAYRLNPEWYGPLLTLGRSYFSLGEYEKSLKYLQAVEFFTGGHGDVSSTLIGVINHILDDKQE